MPPGGSAAQQNYSEESPNEIGADLARAKAEKRGDLRIVDDDYEPYPDEEPTDNNISEPYPAGRPTSDDNAEEEQEGEGEQEQSPKERKMEEERKKQNLGEAGVTTDKQFEIALSIARNKEHQLNQIKFRIGQLEKQLSELEKDLTDFKNSKLNDLLKIFQPGIVQLVDQLIEQLKKQADKLSDEAKVGYYTGLITTASALINSLRALKLFTSVLDAAFIWRFSCLRLVITTAGTIILPIIIIVLSPIFIPFFALLFIIGVIPLLKGVFTKAVNDLITTLKKQRTAWRAQLEKVKKKVTLKKQIKALKSMQKQIERKK